jgi:hypothetical protein
VGRFGIIAAVGVGGHAVAHDYRRRMHAIDLLNGDAAELPRPAAPGDFQDHLAQLFGDYLAAVDALTATDYARAEIRRERPTIEAAGQDLLKALDASLRGQPGAARDGMARAVTRLRPFLDRLATLPVTPDGIGTVYRLATDLDSSRRGRAGVFHIPFQLRRLVATRRYSLPGVPCLYLGATSYICEKELRPAPASTKWISAFRVRAGKTLRVLNMAYRPALVAALLDTHGLRVTATVPADFAVAWAVAWPLIAACSCERAHETDPFVVEYVLPQLLLSWVSEQPDLHGIRYFSTREREYDGELLSMNFALPARDGGRTGFSSALIDLLEWTEPLEWDDARRRGVGRPEKVRGGTVSTPTGKAAYSTTTYADVDRGVLTAPFGSP